MSSEVAVIGGRNSAAEAALDLFRHGARVTLVHRAVVIGPRACSCQTIGISLRCAAQSVSDVRAVEKTVGSPSSAARTRRQPRRLAQSRMTVAWT